MANWYNNDGLLVKLGTSEAAVVRGGEYPPAGTLRVIEQKITLTNLTTSDAIQNYGILIPSGARIEEVEVEVETAATSGGSATLTVGLIRQDTTTTYDSTALVSAAALSTIDTAGKRLNLITGSTAAGTKIGTTLANTGYIVAKYGTAAFTAGEVLVRVRFIVPQPAVTNS